MARHRSQRNAPSTRTASRSATAAGLGTRSEFGSDSTQDDDFPADAAALHAARVARAIDNARLVDPEAPGSEEPFEYDGPSKSQRKRDMTALQKLGAQLIELPTSVLRSLELPERLTDAIIEMGNTRTHEGRRRQMQFIGKLMREVDPEPIQLLLDRRERPHRDEVNAMHLAERWRERLIADDRVIDEFVQATGCGELQALRTNIRAARVEHAAQRNGRQYRLLYQRIRAAMAPGSGPENGPEDGPDVGPDVGPGVGPDVGHDDLE